MKIFSQVLKLRKLFSSLDVKLTSFLAPVIFSLGASLFEGVSVGLLIPLVNGIVNMDFAFIKTTSAFRGAADLFPGISGISNTAIFISLIGIIFCTGVLKNVLQYVSGTLVSFQVRKIANSIRKNIFERYLGFGKMFYDRNNVGYLYSVLINYTSVITEQIKNVNLLLSELFMFFVYMLLMFIISWKLTLLACVLFPPLNFILKWLIRRIKKTSEYYEFSSGEISKNISNILSCMPLVKLYGYEEKEYKHFSSLSNRIQEVEFSLDKKYNLIRPMQEVFSLAIIILIVLAIVLVSVTQKKVEIAGFLMFFVLLRRAQGSFLAFINFAASLATVVGPIKAISRMFDKEDKFLMPEGKEVFSGLKNTIEFRHLNFFYSKERSILKDVSFSVEKGKIVAIVGPTGSGKTTLINLILRFYDCPLATIFVDGRDIRDFTFKSLRAHMALVSQDTFLFNDTVRNNITYGLNDGISDQILMDVIKKARLYDFISELRDGLDTYIGDKGVRLSGGERQRVSIARALLKGSEVLMLDEATSSLDTKTERLIQEAINEAIRERTAIVVAHRLSTIKNADKIIFMEEGRIIEQGPLNELLQKKGRFHEAWQEQKFY